jgi:hypothetical protein
MKCFRRAFLGNLIGRAEPAIALGPVRAQTHALIAVGDGFVPHAKTCIGSAAVAEEDVVGRLFHHSVRVVLNRLRST